MKIDHNGDRPKGSDILHASFRVLTPEDAGTLSRLLLDSSPEYMRFFHPFAFDGLTIRHHLERAKKDVFFGVEVGSASARELAGFYMMRGLDEGYPNPMYGIFVSPPFAGNGLARLTLVHAVSFCKLNDYEKILLKVDPRNVRAKKLYESCGFCFLREQADSRDVIFCKDVNSHQPEEITP
jgi:RimJ/RimL family protein N-acetyltransferase